MCHKVTIFGKRRGVEYNRFNGTEEEKQIKFLGRFDMFVLSRQINT